jgi:hypothetical protein
METSLQEVRCHDKMYLKNTEVVKFYDNTYDGKESFDSGWFTKVYIFLY